MNSSSRIPLELDKHRDTFTGSPKLFWLLHIFMLILWDWPNSELLYAASFCSSIVWLLVTLQFTCSSSNVIHQIHSSHVHGTICAWIINLCPNSCQTKLMFKNIPELNLNNHGLPRGCRTERATWGKMAAITAVWQECLLRKESCDAMCQMLGDILLGFGGGTQRIPELFALLNSSDMSIWFVLWNYPQDIHEC